MPFPVDGERPMQSQTSLYKRTNSVAKQAKKKKKTGMSSTIIHEPISRVLRLSNGGAELWNRKIREEEEEEEEPGCFLMSPMLDSLKLQTPALNNEL